MLDFAEAGLSFGLEAIGFSVDQIDLMQVREDMVAWHGSPDERLSIFAGLFERLPKLVQLIEPPPA